MYVSFLSVSVRYVTQEIFEVPIASSQAAPLDIGWLTTSSRNF